MRQRLLLIILATTSLVVIAFALPLAALVENVAEDRAITLAERDIASLAPLLAVTNDKGAVEGALSNTVTGRDKRLTVWLPDGTPVGNSADYNPDSLRLAQEKRLAFTENRPSGLDLYTPVLLSGNRVAVVRASVPLSMLDAGVQRAWVILGVIALSLIGAAGFIADRLARSVNVGARQLAGTARSLAGGNATARAQSSTVPELDDAASALNMLADRIDELRSAERERVADLSHRLRTPLTALRLEVESVNSVALLDDLNRLESAVTELIRNARRPLHESLGGDNCDAISVTKERANFWGALADDDERKWTLAADDAEAPVALSESELVAAIDVLIGNVFSHTPDGVGYSVSARIEDAFVVLTVDDKGPGITEIENAIERGTTRNGSTGLGLDIARQAAEASGGTIAIGTNTDGGASISLKLLLLKK